MKWEMLYYNSNFLIVVQINFLLKNLQHQVLLLSALKLFKHFFCIVFERNSLTFVEKSDFNL